jgi:acetyl-CoA acyltransferase 1
MCSSGLQAIINVAAQIRSGEIDMGIGGGVESMSMFSMQGMVDPECIADASFEHPEAQLCMMSMGVTSENVAEKYGITRE